MDFQVFNLTLAERFALLDLLPQQGNFAALGLIEGLKKELAPSETDFKECEIEEFEGGRIKWNVTKDKGKDFEIGPKLFELIYKALDDAEKGNQLKVQHYTLFGKIALPKREAEAAENAKNKE